MLVGLAAVLAAAGLPLYVHLPRFAAETGMGLGTVGALLLVFRLFDLVQDPLLGLLADRWRRWRRGLAMGSLIAMGIGFFWVFTLQPGIWELAAGLAVLFTGFSLGMILFYSQGVGLAQGAGEHLRLAGLREAGTLTGIVIAALLPTLFAVLTNPARSYALFGLVMLGLSVLAALATRGFWTADAMPPPPRLQLRPFLAAGGGRLLALALINALPVALTSSLFLFFVEDRLQLPHLAGPYLLLFFVAAGVSAPLWSRLAARFGARQVLVPAMVLAILAFLWTATLAPGAGVGFAVITVLSGVALGADMVILPALFANVLARADLPAGAAFGTWFLAGKLALALAAATALPILQRVGYVPGGDNSPEVLQTLTALYALVPCALKLPAIWMVLRLPQETRNA